VTLPSSRIKADQARFEKASAPCLTKAFTANLVAESSGGTDTSAAKAANKPLLYEAVFQLIMQSSRPLMNPYLRALKLTINVSDASGAGRTKVVELAKVFSQAQHLHTCPDASKWAAANYSAASEPQGVKLIASLETLAAGNFPSTGRFRGLTTTQASALKKLTKLAGKRFQAIIKQMERGATSWLTNVLLQATQDAEQQTTTTSTSTTTTPTTTTTSTQ
jgi:hypothetical protein